MEALFPSAQTYLFLRVRHSTANLPAQTSKNRPHGRFCIWRRRRDCSAFALHPRKPHPSFHSGLPCGHPAQAVLAGRTQAGSFTHPLNQIEKGTHADALFNLAEKAGFEPALGYYPKHAFQACDLNHSSTSPKGAQNKPERLLLQLNPRS